MLLFGHLGLGNALSEPFLRPGRPESRSLFPWICLGTLLPDLIDKPLFHLLKIANRANLIESVGLITSTRTIGHTALFLIASAGFASFTKSRARFAVTLGVATHLFLDNLLDQWVGASPSSALIALIFPLYEGRFSEAPFDDLEGHLALSVTRLETLSAEALGLVLFLYFFIQFRKYRQNSQLGK